MSKSESSKEGAKESIKESKHLEGIHFEEEEPFPVGSY